MAEELWVNADEELRRQLVRAVADGVKAAFEEALERFDLKDAITNGVEKALDQLWPSQIQEAIQTGVKAAMDGRR